MILEDLVGDRLFLFEFHIPLIQEVLKLGKGKLCPQGFIAPMFGEETNLYTNVLPFLTHGDFPASHRDRHPEFTFRIRDESPIGFWIGIGEEDTFLISGFSHLDEVRESILVPFLIHRPFQGIGEV